MKSQFKFSVGSQNAYEGADAFGSEVRRAMEFSKKVEKFKKIGFDAVQFHDNDAIRDMNNLSDVEIMARARGIKKFLDNNCNYFIHTMILLVFRSYLLNGLINGLIFFTIWYIIKYRI